MYHLIHRPIDAGNLTIARLREFNKHKEMVENHKQPDSMPTLSKTYTTTKFLDQFHMHLRELYGVMGIAIS